MNIVGTNYDFKAKGGSRIYLDRDGIQNQMIARVSYNFATHGGAVGDIPLNVSLPKGAIITKGYINVTEAVAGDSTSTIAVSVEADDDILAAGVIGTNGTSGWHAGVPDGTVAKFVTTTEIRAVTLTVGTKPLTAGKFTVYLEYIM